MQVDKKQIFSSAQQLTKWFRSQARDLPWRANKNPYFIWISEVMLQQTTSKAVVPFFKSFLLKFPDVETLAAAREEEVLSAWSGLGYYSRAKNLHRAAQKISQMGAFPKTAEELLLLPGFGPYTSRAVASLAFSEPVGVVDGNVIRVLSRVHAISEPWWNRNGFQQIQNLSDLYAKSYAKSGDPGNLNAGLMELGATVCRPQSPLCGECPLQSKCRARITGSQNQYPAIRPRKKMDWVEWQPQIIEKNGKLALIKNDYAPFLKTSWIFPGSFRELKQKPEEFAFSHTITHRQIFVTFGPRKESQTQTRQMEKSQTVIWIPPEDLAKKNPSALLKKAISMWKKESGLLRSELCRVLACAGLLVISLLPACKTHSPPTSEVSQTKSPAILPDGSRAISMLGENLQPRLAKSGDRFLFVSRGRAAHRHPQIYEYSFLTNKERRLTFNDSLSWAPDYHPKDPIFFYSSATDESKENKAIFQRQILGIPSPGSLFYSPYSPFFDELNSETSLGDIYSSTFDGFEIVRWIRGPGLQTNLHWDEEGKVSFYSSFTKGQFKLLKVSGGKTTEWGRQNPRDPGRISFFPELSSLRKELAWVESSPDGKKQSLLHSTWNQFLPKILQSITGQFRGLTWAQEGLWLIYSARSESLTEGASPGRTQTPSFDLFAVRISDSCTLQLTNSSYDEIYPSWNSATSEIYFSANSNGLFQIYAKKLTLETCPTSASSPTNR